MSEPPRLIVILDKTETSAAVLRAARSFMGAGLMETKDCIRAHQPVINIEMFTNAWYGGRGVALLDLLTSWQAQGVGFALWEMPENLKTDTMNSVPVPLDVSTLRTIIEASHDDDNPCGAEDPGERS